MKRIIHTADLHLGMTFKSLGDKSKLHRLDCQETFSNIVDLCIKEKIDALLIAGDFFDTPNPPKNLVKYVDREFQRLDKENIPIFISTGNHDPYIPGSIWLEHKFPDNTIIFDTDSLEPKTINGITVYGIAYKDDITRPLEGFNVEKDNTFQIGLLHGSTLNINWEEQPEAGYRPISKEDIENSGLDYIALGHFHDLMDLKTSIPCYYSGSPEGLSFKNEGDRYILLVTYDNGTIDIQKRKINKRFFKTIEFDCTDQDSDYEIRKILSNNSGENIILRLKLIGNPPLDFSIDLDLLEKEFESRYFYLKIVDDIHIPKNLIEDETVRGTFIRLLRDEIEREQDEKRKKQLENALRIGINYLDRKM